MVYFAVCDLERYPESPEHQLSSLNTLENAAKQDEILNIKIKRAAHCLSEENLNIFLYSFKLFNNLSKKCTSLLAEKKVKYTLVISLESLSANAVELILTTPAKRQELIEDGRKCADLFMNDHSIM